MLSPPLGNRSAESVKHRQLSLLWTQQQRDGTHTLPGLFSPRFSLAPGGIYDHPATITKGAEVASVSLTWGGDYRFDAVDKGEVPVDIDGGGTLGVRPSDLLPMALAGCSGVDVLNLLGADRVSELEITVRYTKEPDPPWRFQRFYVLYRVSGSGITEEEVRGAVQKSHDEMCSVSHAIRGNVPVETTVEIVTSDQ